MTRIGKYQIIEQVGEGAMGVVYKAIDPVLNRPVAVKVMNEGMAQDQALRERFLREAQAAGSLQHPNVVTIYDFGETDGHLFIAMEFIQGSDLEQLMERKVEMPLSQKLDIIIDVLNGLAYAHRRGLVHRDIKPANIRIDAEGHARIMDFGVVHMASSNLTGTGIMMGTPNYMAPENITGNPVTAAADIFSVGAVMYELLTNRKPFEADTLHRVLFRIVSDPTPDLHEVEPGLPTALNRIIRKALAKELADRYGNATEMANDISAVRATLGAPRASRTVSQRSSIERGLKLQREQQTRALRRWKIIAGTTAAALALGVVGLTVYRLRTGQDAPQTLAQSTRPDSTPAFQSGAPASPGTGATTSIAAPPPGASPPVASQRADSTNVQAPASRTTAANTRQASRPPVTQRDTARSTRRDMAQAPQRPAVPDSIRQAAQLTAANTQANVVIPPPSPQPTLQAPATNPQVTSPIPAETTVSRPPPPAPPVVENPAPAINGLVAAYARAIGTRNVAEVKRAYPGMTTAQQSAWESFFGSVRSMRATFDVSNLEVDGTDAVARLTGVYEFVNRSGRTERQPANFTATFQRDANGWRLIGIK